MAAYMVRSLLPTLAIAAALLALRSIESPGRTPLLVAAELCGYSGATLALTWTLERPLLREGIHYARQRDTRRLSAEPSR
jgi:hypothetical protein